ncbi:MAG: ribonuclease R [Candidatus Yonathbacteria bacterium CG23_combo_of_CG06-09_8_20_14_all_46_18]|nr:MAG: ribonuclease R [Candidatus Yonathbacteria bacterium CG23_combo_of_CG06-09_8_20_14_all_46_18]
MIDNDAHFIGTIRITARGDGYVSPTGRRDDSVKIDHVDLNTALHGDTVNVFRHPKKTGGEERGEVIEVMRRTKDVFAGVLEKNNGSYFFVPDDQKMYIDILIPEQSLAGARNKEKVVVRIAKWNDPKKNPEGEVIKVLGKPEDNNVEMESIVYDKGFLIEFSNKVEREALKIQASARRDIEEEAPKRKDMRGVTTFTIDPATAKDFDDAISFRELPNGNIEAGVHIADVTHYVRPGSIIEDEARKRATSIYLVDRTIPMLPEELSNNICSLKPNEDRLAFSAIFTFKKDSLAPGANPEIIDQWIGETIINSDKRFSYEEAQGVLDGKDGPFRHELKTLNVLAKNLRAERIRAGAIMIEQDEITFSLDDRGKPESVAIKVHGDTNELIEELMLLANRAVAEAMTGTPETKKRTFIFRIHPKPESDRIAELAEFLGTLGYSLKPGLTNLSHGLNTILKQSVGTEVEHIVHTVTIRSLQKAVYSTQNVGHFGLAFKYYTHFTSPIRRYPDMMTHRLVKTYLAGKTVPPNEAECYDSDARHSSEMEQRAAEAERDSIKYKQIEFMIERGGETYEGIISGVTDWGIYVEEKTTKAEGLIRLRDIGNDYYVLDKKNHAIVGEKRGKRYRLGDTVKVRIKDANLERRTVDYLLV